MVNRLKNKNEKEIEQKQFELGKMEKICSVNYFRKLKTLGAGLNMGESRKRLL